MLATNDLLLEFCTLIFGLLVGTLGFGAALAVVAPAIVLAGHAVVLMQMLTLARGHWQEGIQYEGLACGCLVGPDLSRPNHGPDSVFRLTASHPISQIVLKATAKAAETETKDEHPMYHHNEC